MAMPPGAAPPPAPAWRGLAVASFGDVSLDARNGCLLAGERSVPVRPAVCRLMAALLAARGEVVGADVLRGALRKPGAPEVSSDSLRLGLTELRRALATVGASTGIENRRGYGWRLARQGG